MPSVIKTRKARKRLKGPQLKKAGTIQSNNKWKSDGNMDPSTSRKVLKCNCPLATSHSKHEHQSRIKNYREKTHWEETQKNYSYLYLCVCMLSCAQLFATPWTVFKEIQKLTLESKKHMHPQVINWESKTVFKHEVGDRLWSHWGYFMKDEVLNRTPKYKNNVNRW